MEVKAKVKYVRIGARKVRRVARLIVGAPVARALVHLRFLPHQGAKVLEGVLRSAAANAKHNYKLAEESLMVKHAWVDSATPLKRFRPRQRGQAFPILKRSSHVTIVLEDRKGKK